MNTNTIPVPGRKSAIARLITVAALLLLGVIIAFASAFTGEGFLKGIENFAAVIISFLIITPFIWGFIKWGCFMFPKSLRVANAFGGGWIALNLFTLYIKVSLYLIMALAPVMMYGLLLSPVFMLIFALSSLGSSFLSVLLLIVVSTAALAFMVLLDVCKLKNLCWKTVLKNLLAKRR